MCHISPTLSAMPPSGPSSSFLGYQVTERTLHRPDTPPLPPRYTLSEETLQDFEAIARADQDLERYRLDPISARRLLEDALTRNAYGTASIEGNPLTLDEVESLLERGPTPENRLVPDEREIINHAALMDDLETQDLPRTPDDVAALHATLFEGVLVDAGSFKDTENFIGRRLSASHHQTTSTTTSSTGRRHTREVIYVPTPPERVVPELQTALDLLHGELPDDDRDHHPLVRAFVFFHEFQGIHPFRDGNGRVGRALNTIILHRFGYPGIRYAFLDYAFNEDRGPYYDTLAEVERSDYDFTPWIAYMARTLRTAMEDAVERFVFRQRLPRTLNDRQTRLATWFGRMDHERPGRRLKFNDIHAANPTYAARTLRRDLGRLVDEGILVREGEKKGTKYHLEPGSRR